MAGVNAKRRSLYSANVASKLANAVTTMKYTSSTGGRCGRIRARRITSMRPGLDASLTCAGRDSGSSTSAAAKFASEMPAANQAGAA